MNPDWVALILGLVTAAGLSFGILVGLDRVRAGRRAADEIHFRVQAQEAARREATRALASKFYWDEHLRYLEEIFEGDQVMLDRIQRVRVVRLFTSEGLPR